MKKLLLLSTLLALLSLPSLASAARCTAVLKRANGVPLQTFVGNGFNQFQACQQAESNCQRDLRLRQRMGRNPMAYCQVERRMQQIVESCRVGLFQRYHNVRTFMATASGFNPHQVKQKACDKAMNQCLRFRTFRDVCRIF